jgi:succinyl-diaminopimelate desuccinylase
MARDQRTALAEQIVGILGDLIAIPSPYPPGDTKKITAYAGARLISAGYKTEVVEPVPGIASVVARHGKGHPCLVFNAHSDTVAVSNRADWKTDPLKATFEGRRVVGLGAGNCKGSMAVQLWLADEIARRGGPKRGELVFTFVGDEETLGPNGMRYLREKGLQPDCLVLGAQTENQLIVAERGVMWARLTTHGRAAHAGNPAAGDNAILRMLRLVSLLERKLGPELRKRRAGRMQSTINLGTISGGSNTNVVPSQCVVEFDRRLLPDEKVTQAFKEMAAILRTAKEPRGSYDFDFLTGTNGFRAPASGAAVQAFKTEIRAHLGKPAKFLNATGVSDGRYFADDGIEIINFGPGSGAEGHAANESVPIDQLVDAAIIQLAVVGRLLGLD